jgi:hypothetical protein
VRLDPAFADTDGVHALILRVRDDSASPRGIRHPLWLSTRKRGEPEKTAKSAQGKT